MGLFDFFKKKEPISLPEREGPSPDYVFAHLALRHISLGDPLQFLAIMAAPDAIPFLESVLKDVAKQCGKPTSFTVNEIQIHQTRVNNCPCALLEFPEPEEMAEAIMVALVVYLDPTSDLPPDLENLRARYFTLEKGYLLTGDSRTVFCEWSGDRHNNYGDGPTATVEAFVEAMKSHV